MPWIIAGIILTAGALGVLVLFLNRRRRRDPGAPRTYSGPIRVTGPNGRIHKIVQKDDGSFAMEEEPPRR